MRSAREKYAYGTFVEAVIIWIIWVLLILLLPLAFVDGHPFILPVLLLFREKILPFSLGMKLMRIEYTALLTVSRMIRKNSLLALAGFCVVSDNIFYPMGKPPVWILQISNAGPLSIFLVDSLLGLGLRFAGLGVRQVAEPQRGHLSGRP